MTKNTASGFHRGARYLMGDNLKVVWAAFSALNSAELAATAWQVHTIA
jgi:hypothetical protein